LGEYSRERDRGVPGLGHAELEQAVVDLGGEKARELPVRQRGATEHAREYSLPVGADHTRVSSSQLRPRLFAAFKPGPMLP